MAPAETRAATAEAPPGKDVSHSGRLLLRMPPALHADLARAAEREGMSLNAFITRELSGSLEPAAQHEPPAQPEPDRGSRWLRIAIVADLVLVAVAAIVAVTLLLVAWP